VIVGSVMMMVCGWYYARNVSLYGTPFKLSREEFMVAHVENTQPHAERGILDYITFDPMIFRRPEWPRSFVPGESKGPGGILVPVRNSVWTGMYVNAWFEGFGGGWVLPAVTQSDLARHSGQALLVLGAVPSGLVLLGLWTALARLRREGWDDTIVAMLLTFAAMVGIFIHGTRVVPIPASVKATYFIAIAVPFSFWFALGLERLGRWRPGWLRLVGLECAALAVLSVAVFWQGFLFDASLIDPRVSPATTGLENQYGVVYYAGGDKETAQVRFESAAMVNWHLAYENLGSLALEEGRRLQALHYLKDAMRLQPRQSSGLPRDRLRFNLATQAEYLNSMSVIYHQLGWSNDALEAARQALARDGSIPEAHYNLGVLKLERALDLAEDAGRWKLSLVEQAGRHFFNATIIDPAFFESSAMLGVVQAMTGKCDNARATIERALEPHPGSFRKYPVVTGRGIPHAASIRRRRHIESLPENIDPRTYLDICKEEGVEGA
jgi:tetratricopeptide (TPR) repeat protein